MDMTDPPGPAAGHDLGDAFGCIVLLGHAEDPLDLSPAPVPVHVCLLRCVRTQATLRRTEKPPLDTAEPL